MANREFYEKIVDLTAEIAVTGVGMKLVAAGKTGDNEKVKEVLETFKKENAELFQSIEDFEQEYEEEDCPYIFIEGEFEYDSEEIDAFNLSIFFAISGIRDIDVFYDTDDLYDALREKGHEKMVTYMEELCIRIESFVKIFAE